MPASNRALEEFDLRQARQAFGSFGKAGGNSEQIV